MATTKNDDVYPTLAHEIIAGTQAMSLPDAVRIEPWSLNTRDICGFTPLHWAVVKGCPDAIRALTSLGADVNAGDLSGYTPLH